MLLRWPRRSHRAGRRRDIDMRILGPKRYLVSYESMVAGPGEEQRHPRHACAKGEAVAPVLKQMKLRRLMESSQRLGHGKAVLRLDHVIIHGMCQEDRR